MDRQEMKKRFPNWDDLFSEIERLEKENITFRNSCQDWEKRCDGLRERVGELEKAIEELIAYGMPKHIEEALQKLLERR